MGPAAEQLIHSILELPKPQLCCFFLSTGLAAFPLLCRGYQSHKLITSLGNAKQFHLTQLWDCVDLPLLRAIFQAFRSGVFIVVSERCRKVSPDFEKSLTSLLLSHVNVHILP